MAHVPPPNPLRFLVAAGAQDCAGALVNVVGSALSRHGVEVINADSGRGVEALVAAAVQGGAHAAVASSAGDTRRVEYFTALRESLDLANAGYVLLFGCGCAFTPLEIAVLERRGVTVFDSERVRRLGPDATLDVMLRAGDIAVQRSSPSRPARAGGGSEAKRWQALQFVGGRQ